MSAPRTGRGTSWIGATLLLPSRLEEQVLAAFWEAGCLGVQVHAAAQRVGHPRVALEAWFPGRISRRALEGRLRRSWRAVGLPRAARPCLARVPDGRWVEAWQSSLKPMRIGRTILALPEGCPPPRATDRIVIRIPFGQAFGTGEHASTRLSLRLLERHLTPGDRVVDLGTGTGILAVAALRLGAASVLAVDADHVAVRVARDTLRRNRLTRGVRLRRCDAAVACRGGPFDLALVNIGASVIARILPALSQALTPGGRALLAGILIDDEPVLVAQAGLLGFAVAARLHSRPWAALLLRRPRS